MNHDRMMRSLLARAASLDEEELRDLIDDGQLDEHFRALGDGAAWLTELAAVHPEPTEFLAAASRLVEQQHEILRWYQRFFSVTELVGEPAACEAPDFIVVLACRTVALMKDRVQAAIPLIAEHPDACVVLSGGGFDPLETEARLMQRTLEAEQVVCPRLLLEEDSIDTVGNAIFTRLRLRQEGLLTEPARLVIVTSDFHAVRSLNIFRKSFGAGCEIAVVPVATARDLDEELDLAAHELMTDSRSSAEIFCLRDFFAERLAPIAPGDDRALFLQLLLHHDLYKHRYDLVRKYGSVLLDEP